MGDEEEALLRRRVRELEAENYALRTGGGPQSREQEVLKLRVTAAERAQKQAETDLSRARAQLELDDVEHGRARFYRVPLTNQPLGIGYRQFADGGSLYIWKVEQGTEAARAGVVAPSLLLRVGGVTPTSVDELRRTITMAKDKGDMSITLLLKPLEPHEVPQWGKNVSAAKAGAQGGERVGRKPVAAKPRYHARTSPASPAQYDDDSYYMYSDRDYDYDDGFGEQQSSAGTSGRGWDRRTQTGRKLHWRGFVNRFDRLNHHWSQIEPDVVNRLDDRINATIGTVDFEREAEMLFERRLQSNVFQTSPPTNWRDHRDPQPFHNGFLPE